MDCFRRPKNLRNKATPGLKSLIRLAIPLLRGLSKGDALRNIYFRYSISLLATGTISAMANYVDVRRTDPCCDWIVHRGLPFAILKRGGFGEMHQFLPAGITADLLVMLLISGLIARIWEGISRDRAKRPGT